MVSGDTEMFFPDGVLVYVPKKTCIIVIYGCFAPAIYLLIRISDFVSKIKSL